MLDISEAILSQTKFKYEKKLKNIFKNERSRNINQRLPNIIISWRYNTVYHDKTLTFIYIQKYS